MPVNMNRGDTVLAGSVVTDGALTARVTCPSLGSRLAQIASLVDQALGTKPPIQRLADTASAWFAIGILGVAILTALGWLMTGHTLAQAVLTSVAVLVVACPCALGLATPLAMTVAVGRAAQAGVVIRNPEALETAVQVGRMVFDKTGTLTRGQMSVVVVEVAPAAPAAEGLSEDQLLCLAAAVEQYSEHPIVRAIVAACRGPMPTAGEFQSLRGMGASARVGDGAGRRVMVGSTAFLGVDDASSLASSARLHAEKGETVVWVGWDDAPAGFVALRDEANPTAPEALTQLARAGIRQVMLSGDSQKTVESVAAELGLREFAGNWSPARKMEQIRAWQAAGERVGMAGDGVNDAPALAQADLSITVAGGTDVAGDTSDVVLMRNDLTLIPWFIGFSRRTRQIIRQNLGWAFAYNLVSVSLAAVGAITPVIAAVAMAASSLLVVGNSLRLQR